MRSLGRPIALALALVCATVAGAQARHAGPPRNLECRDIRRLSDNFLLDLRIRLVFARARHSYIRLENTGRGWQPVDERRYLSVEPTRIVLADNPYFTTYVERLTGDYYHVDRTGTGLSVWGRCALVGGLNRLF